MGRTRGDATASGRVATGVGAGLAAVAVAVLLGCAVTARATWWEVLAELPDLVPVAAGILLHRRAPHSPVGPALLWTGTCVLAVRSAEYLGATSAWPWQFLGAAALLTVFPDGLPGRWARRTLGSGVLGSVALTWALRSGEPSGALGLLVAAVGAVLFLTGLVGGVVALVLRHRRGSARVRRQLHWLLLAAVAFPVLLVAGWVAQSFGASPGVAYAGVLLTIVVLVPAAVTVAVLREDLLDVDRLLGSTVTTVLTAVVAAGLFAGVTTALTEGLTALRPAATPVAAFVTALVLLPLHRSLLDLVARVTDRDQRTTLARVRRYVEAVRTGDADPAAAQDVLREALGDPGFHLGPDGAARLGVDSARRRRVAREALALARVPLLLASLQADLRASLQAVEESRTRLVEGVAAERRRLERDLHDGAQQRIVAVGMRLRSVQSRLDDTALRAELDQAVDDLADTVAELRRLAQGVRPGMLDDGLSAALDHLARLSPLPLEVVVHEESGARDEVRETTAYFVVAEAVTNAWKHARASRVLVDVRVAADGTVVDVRDDGIGGVGTLGGVGITSGTGGFTALRDRVASVGGRLEVQAPPGGGTRVLAVF